MIYLTVIVTAFVCLITIISVTDEVHHAAQWF
jgi:hypothetical protein